MDFLSKVFEFIFQQSVKENFFTTSAAPVRSLTRLVSSLLMAPTNIPCAMCIHPVQNVVELFIMNVFSLIVSPTIQHSYASNVKNYSGFHLCAIATLSYASCCS